MPAGSGSQGAPASPSSGGGRDVIADMEKNRNEEEWSWTIIGGMARIQTQYAIERGLGEDLPKDYFTDSDKLKYFWSGFANSTATKHILDIVFRSVVNWEILLILLSSVFVQVFVFSNMPESKYIDSITFFVSYFSVIGYSIYITRHFNYFIYGDLSARMMLFLMIGRLCFLALSATILSSFLFWMVNYFENAPKELYGWTSGIYWIFNLFGSAYTFLGNKQQFFMTVYKFVLPEIRHTANEMVLVFLSFGLAPFVLLIIGKILRVTRISNERKRFDRGES